MLHSNWRTRVFSAEYREEKKTLSLKHRISIRIASKQSLLVEGSIELFFPVFVVVLHY